MQERVELCQDPQTEFALLREGLGVSRINHILRVHGHAILQEKRAADIDDEVGQRLRGSSGDSRRKVRSKPGIGYKRARDIAAPAHHGALMAAKPCIQAMIQDAVMAGLLPKQPLVTRLAAAMPRQKMRHGSKQLKGTTGPSLRTRQCQNSNSPVRPPKKMTMMIFDFCSAPRKSRLSAPQPQAQLSRLYDRARLRRLQNTLFSKGA